MNIKALQNITLNQWLKILLFCLVIYFPLFLHLDTLSLRMWDEARLAENAYEMNKNGNFIVTYFAHSPDMWNTKPPLMIWLQVLCMKLVGVNLLAIRLPSALAAVATCVLFMFMAIKYLKNYWLGLIIVLVLITSHGYVRVHATRTGDYDSLLTFFTTAYLFAFFLFMEYEDKKYARLFFIGVAFAVLTKSVQALVFLPPLLGYMAIQKKLYLLKNKYLYLYALACLATFGSYYLLREYFNHGYLQAVWDNELGGRYMTALEGHQGDFLYYFRFIINQNFGDWYWLIPCGIAFGMASAMDILKKLSLFFSLTGIFYWIIISSAQTKLEWYETPLYPLLSFLVAVCIYTVFSYLKENIDTTKYLKINILPYIFLFIVFLTPYEKMMNSVYFPQEIPLEKMINQIGHLLDDASKSRRNIKGHAFCHQGDQPLFHFYVNILNDKGNNLTFRDLKELGTDRLIITDQPEVQIELEKTYVWELTETIENIKIYKIHGTKPVN